MSPCLSPSRRKEVTGEELDVKIPIFHTFCGCASAMTSTSRINATRMSSTAAFFIPHLDSGAIYHAERSDLSNKKCSRTLEIELNDLQSNFTGFSRRRIQFNAAFSRTAIQSDLP